MPLGAVITADIVNSTYLPARLEKELRDEIITALKPNKFEFYRGDSFQALVKDPKEALTVVLKTRTIARKINFIHDVRASIGIGTIQTGIRKLNTANDAAFINSGRAFDTLIKSEQKLIIFSDNPIANHGFQTISYFVDYLFQNLTAKQAEVLLVLLNNKTQLDAARQLGKSQSTIHKHAQAGGWPELLRIINEYEALVDKL